MKLFFYLLLFSGFLFTSEAKAQTRFLVKLKNKAGTPFTFSNPSAYLSQRAIDRRTNYGITLDSTDLPATPSYITQIRNVPNVTILNVSKWLNSVSIQTSDPNAINTISGFSFVQGVIGFAARTANGDAPSDKFKISGLINEQPSSQKTVQVEADFYNYGANSFNEINLHKGQFLHNIGLRGQTMRVALLDAGFTNYAILKSFDSMNINSRVLDTWDFVSGNTDVNDHSHGMMCLSTIAANIPGQFIGKAPDASFYLYRTEDAPTEYPIEEHNWACGAERADSIGADVISTSLGYSEFDPPLTGSNYTYADMNGNTTMCAIAADLAAKKGLLVIAAAGNEGAKVWHFIITPADGDSVLAVGAVNAAGTIGNFSSYGPSGDGQIKPDVASVGVAALVQTTFNTVGTNNGTSFACPNMAGLATCLWQGFPEFNNMRIVKALQQAGSIANTPNDRMGYGIPDMKKAFSDLLIEYATSSVSINNCAVAVNWSSKDIAAMKYEIERKLPGETVYTKVGELNPQAGVILSNHSYQFSNTVINSAAGTVSYRIRQVIDTASATFTALYIDTASVSISESCFSNFLINNATSGVTVNNCNATINWSSTDLGNMKYEVERKVPGEIVYTKVGELPAQAGVVLTNHSYQFNNAVINPVAGLVSYRIRQIIDTSAAGFATVYIDTANITLSTTCPLNTNTGILISLAPNPSSGQVSLAVETNFAITDMPVNVYDMKGRLMLKLKLSKGIGLATFDMPVSRLAKGKYTIVVYNNGTRLGIADLIRL